MKKHAYIGLMLGLLTSSLYAQPSESEVKLYLQQTYNSQLNITSLPESFYRCGFKVFSYNYSKDKNAPQKDVGNECLFPLLGNDFTSIRFSDRGRKFYQAIKPQFIQACANSTTSSLKLCTCLHNYYDNKGLGFEDLVDGKFANSKVKLDATKSCKDN